MKKFLLLSAVLILSIASTKGQYNLGWDFGDTEGENLYPSVNSSTNSTGSVVDRNNYDGPSTFISTTAPSSGYTGASGLYNVQIRAELDAAVNNSTTSYIFLTITPNMGYSISINAIRFGSRSTPTGPQAYSIRSSLDNYASDIVTGTLANNSTWSLQEHTGLSISASAAITFRIYGYGGTGSLPPINTATWRVDDIFFSITSGLLPIKFADVSAKTTAAGNTVNWANLTESDMAHYCVEYSTNGKNFKEIATLNPTKNDHGAASYSYTHTTPEADNSFYRIKGVELSGTILYSNIVTTSSADNSGRIQLYPNPAVNGSSALKIASLPKGIYELGVVNLSGQTVYKQSVSHGGGGIYIPIRLPYIAGMYSVKLNGKNTQILKTVIVERR